MPGASGPAAHQSATPTVASATSASQWIPGKMQAKSASVASAPATRINDVSTIGGYPAHSGPQAAADVVGGDRASMDTRAQQLLGNLAGHEATRTAAARAQQLFGNLWASAREQASAVAEAAAAAGLVGEEGSRGVPPAVQPLRRLVTGDRLSGKGRSGVGSGGGASSGCTASNARVSADAAQYFVEYNALDL
eukprot:CAMPEP_0117545248 /NCGR_PEP_ID=MMETSP0784-20121206/45996_1 /TAXON_ID=39447 /ORGANISM="" /LENGTH=192 /DNA_ID=CAMNT_0005342087 /DNA_START=57 /DNA_END=631 /DNA_ORIENTATION=+